jgi:predicted nucleic acid-binding protein
MILIDPAVLLLYFAGDNRVAKIIDLINDNREEGAIFEVGMLELVDKLSKVFDYSETAKRLEAIKNSRIKLIGFDFEIAKKAIKIKNVYKLPMLGAYMIALANHLDATLITADKRLVLEGLKVEYIEPIIK